MALSSSIKEVGYIQGLNTIVSVFLRNNLDEQEVFWITFYFLKKMKVNELMTDGLPKLLVLNYQFSIFL